MKETYFFISFFLSLSTSSNLSPKTTLYHTGVERGLQDLRQEQERLHRGQRAEVGDHDPGPTSDGRRVPGVLERGRPERRRQAGLQRIHQNHATVLKIIYCLLQPNIQITGFLYPYKLEDIHL